MKGPAIAVALGAYVAAAAWTTSGASPYFEDRSSTSGVSAVLRNSHTAEKHQIETMPGGVAVFDYDGDGLPDIYLTNGAPQPSLRKSGPDWWNRLYRNQGDGRFEDVTARAGVAGTGYDMGVAAGDYDNDGHEDLFVTGVRGNTLYHNRGDGTFEDVTRKAGLSGGEWAVSAAWVDTDNDGRLDLFVVRYVTWDPAKEPFCGDARRGLRAYCHPKFYEGLANRLYHNNGDGTFTDVSRASGIAGSIGKGMGVAIADYDGDGRMDIFVANDTVPNFLFHNQGDGTFREVEAGVGFNDDGRALSSMGADFRDLDNDGLPDLFVTALSNETFPYYRNLGRGFFEDLTYATRVGAATMPLSGWGMGIYDFDNDGWKDIFTANGDVQDNSEQFSSRASRQANLLLLNQAGRGFAAHPVGAASLHRGAAFGDFDRDGRVDVVVTRLNETPVLLRNVMAPENHWLALKLVGTRSNRDGIGARVRVRTADGEQVNHVTTAVGYASSSEPVVHFGLGRRGEAERVEIWWPSGKRQVMEHVTGDRYVTVREAE